MLKNSKRLGIFCFYDSEGVVDSYIEYLLEDLRTVLSKLIIVVNGYVNEIGEVKLNKYADCLVVRENTGFDFGAYCEVITKEVGHELHSFDELILCNDTFFGPIVSFEGIIEKMEDKECDFWGLNLVEDSFLTHIQSYFYVFRKKILQSDVLYDFFQSERIKRLVITKDVADIYAAFEVGLFRHLVQAGYRYDTYTNTKGSDIYQFPDTCLVDYALPILKKKCFDDWDNRRESIKRAISYIEYEGKYKVQYFKEYLRRKYNIEIDGSDTVNIDQKLDLYKIDQKLVSENAILKFIEENKEIYIYGSGVYARKIWFIFGDKIERFEGFIVSDGVPIIQSELCGYPIRHYKDIQEGCSVIVGCDYKNTKEIRCNLKSGDKIFEIWKKS